jgi:hypothetical protein
MRTVAMPRGPTGWNSWYSLVGPSVGVGALAALLLNSLTGGLTAGAGALAAGAVWRHGEPPVLSFALAYQWVFMAVPVFYFAATGRGPLHSPVGDLESAAHLSMVGFLFLAAGIRIGATVFGLERHVARVRHRGAVGDLYDPRRLCILVVVMNAVDWVFEIRPAMLFFSIAQFVLAILALRQVFLLALFYVVLRRGSGYLYALVGLLSAIIPRLSSVQSTFKEPLFMILIAGLAEWSRLRWGDSRRRRRARVLLGGVAVGTVGLLIAGVIWEGAIKPVWRYAGTQGSPMEKVAVFYRTASLQASMMDARAASERLASRLSTGIFFAYVLDRVPQVVPHTGGDLLMGALRHVTQPRFLYPDKANLGSGSERAELYAGITVGEGTSVSVGYMAEFYVDFGVPGMFVPVLVFGALVGAIYAFAARLAPSWTLFAATVTVLFVNTFLTFEGNFTKILGGMAVSAVVFLSFLALIAPRLHGVFLPDHETVSQLPTPPVAPGAMGRSTFRED